MDTSMKLTRPLLKLVITLAFYLMCATGFAAESPPAPAPLAELKTAVIAVMEEQDVPAVGIAMVNADGPIWVEALGKSNLEKDIDADEKSMFRIGSTSKMFVALSVLKLVEEGKLSLDDKVSDLAPEIKFTNQWANSDPVRVVHLLEHTTGWDDLHLQEYANNDPSPISLEAGLAFHPHSRISRWKPGSRMSYCNSGPPVAAYIVQKISGVEFEEYVKQNFFEPMAMETMTYRLSEDVKAHGVTLYDNDNEEQDYWHIIMRPSGSINASVMDMAKFVSFYINRGRVDGQQLISPESLQRMETTVSTSAARAGQQAGYGLNNYSSSHEQWVFRAHNGGVNGGLTELAYLPEARVGHTIMINSGNGSALKAISKLVRNFETRHLSAANVTTEARVNEENRAIAGYYYPINPRQQMTYFLDRVLAIEKLWFEGDRLARKGLFDDKVDYYLPVSDDLYQSEKTGQISLSRATDPLAGDVVHAGRMTLKAMSPALVYAQLGTAVIWGLFIATSLLFFPIWGIRRLLGKVPSGATISIRSWPLLASVSVTVFMVLILVGFDDLFAQLGGLTAISVGITVATLAFALFAVLGVYSAARYRHTAMNRGVFWYSSLASLINLTLAIYLLFFGVIGLMTWA